MTAKDDLFGTIYPRGHVLFQQGAHGDTMFVIQSGAVELTRSEDGREVVLAIMERGDFFGEMSLIDSGPRSATARTVQTSRLLEISRHSLLEHASRDPSIMINLMAALCMRIEKTNRLLQSTIFGDESLQNLATEPKSPDAQTSPEQFNECEGMNERVNVSVEDESGIPLSQKSEPSSWHPLFDNSNSFCEYKAGQAIFSQGDPGDKMYLVLNGQVEICNKSDDEMFTLAVLRENDFFGEMALITGSPRSCSVVALTDVRFVSVDREEFLSMMRSRPEMGLYIIESLINRLRATNAAIHDPSRCAEVIRQVAPPKFRKRSRMRVAIISLASCGGCAASLLQDSVKLGELTDMVEICYCPMLMDAPDFDEVDLALVDGVVRLKEEEEKLLEARKKSRFLVAWGSCSAIGGIPSLANDLELEGLVEETYGKAMDPLAYYMSGNESVSSEAFQKHDGAGLLRKAGKLDDFVRVDYFAPGCPPSIGTLIGIVRELKGLLEGRELKQIVCSECSRKPKKIEISEL
ncbi:MAG: cyclic nucleotide-binding domain-containing protein, partial [Pseudomonadota bacterium]